MQEYRGTLADYMREHRKKVAVLVIHADRFAKEDKCKSSQVKVVTLAQKLKIPIYLFELKLQSEDTSPFPQKKKDCKELDLKLKEIAKDGIYYKNLDPNVFYDTDIFGRLKKTPYLVIIGQMADSCIKGSIIGENVDRDRDPVEGWAWPPTRGGYSNGALKLGFEVMLFKDAIRSTRDSDFNWMTRANDKLLYTKEFEIE